MKKNPGTKPRARRDKCHKVVKRGLDEFSMPHGLFEAIPGFMLALDR